MKVLVIRAFPSEIKAESLTYNVQEIGLAFALTRKGCQADVLCCSEDGSSLKVRELTNDGLAITLYTVPAFKFLKNGFPKKIDYILEKYDVLQVTEYNQLYTWYLSKKYPKKTICYHGPYYSAFNKKYNKMAFLFDLLFLKRYKKLNTPFITKSNLAKEYLVSKGLKNVTSIGVGLHASFMVDALDQNVIPEIAKLEHEECLKLLYIGAVEPRRNPFFLLQVLKKLIDAKVEAKLIVVGKFKSDSYRNDFYTMLKSLELEDCLVYIPAIEQKNLRQVYMLADVFLLPTFYDIYGMVLLEAMYFGVPVLTTLNGGANMMIKNGENGFIVPEFITDKWVKIVLRLKNNKMLAEKIGEKARQTIIESFTWDRLVDKFIAAYERI